MSNEKLSDKEEAALDQTFGEYGEESAETATATPVADDKGAQKKKSGNTLIFIGAGAAAVIFVGYKFFLSPMINPVPLPHASINPQVQTTASTANPAAPVVPVVPVVATGPAAAAAPDSTTIAKEFMNATGQATPPALPLPTPASQTTTTTTTTAPNIQPEPVIAATIPSSLNVGVAPGGMTAPVNPVVATTTPVVVAKDDGKALNMLEEIRNLFEKQTKDTSDSIGSLDKRVAGLEQGQSDLVKSMEARLSKLENNRVIRAIPVVKSTPIAQDNANKPVNADTPIRVNRKPATDKAAKPILAVSTVNTGEDILFTNKSSFKDMKETKEEDSLGKYTIHAIYGNRFYLRNADGTHRSYVVGDKLPEGEVVTKIDDEKYQIVTNKGIIRAF